MSPADQLTIARALSVPIVIVLYAWDFSGHAYWGTAVFCVAMTTDFFDGRLARRHGRTSALGSLLDPIADKVLVLGTMVMLVGLGVVPAWMIAAIVVREVLITGLRQAAIERGIVIAARDLGKLKTWAQAVAAALGGFAAAGAWATDVAWSALLVAVVLTWASGLDYARSAPPLFRARASAARSAARAAALGSGTISTFTRASLKGRPPGVDQSCSGYSSRHCGRDPPAGVRRRRRRGRQQGDVMGGAADPRRHVRRRDEPERSRHLPPGRHADGAGPRGSRVRPQADAPDHDDNDHERCDRCQRRPARDERAAGRPARPGAGPHQGGAGVRRRGTGRRPAGALSLRHRGDGAPARTAHEP